MIHPTFGSAPEGTACVPRRAAYAIIRRADGRVAAVREGGEWFLPGGGLEADETPEQALAREADEELGRSLHIGERVADVLQYFYSGADACWYSMTATFFRAELEPRDGAPEPEWLDPLRQGDLFFHECHAWAARNRGDMDRILIGKGDHPVHLLAAYGNRHGMTAGATGTGKTVSMMVLAEGFSRLGVPVFMADVKGDVAGLALPGSGDDKVRERAARVGISDYGPEASPVIFWDLYGALGHPVRTTISEIGPALLAHMLELNDVQSGVIEVAFRLADDRGLLLLDLEDLRALLGHVAENRKEISTAYGLVSTPSIAAIQRSLLGIEREGGEAFFGEPALELADLMRTDPSGRGVISVLAADRLVLKPRLYSSFLLWLLSELFESLPEVGDREKPKLVFMFDEAHLLFDDAPPALLQRVEQVVRLVRSKGVGVYFCSQFPDDVPGEMLGQLGNRIQHALRAYTPRDQKAVRAAAETFVPNPALDVAQVIGQLAVGEALVSTLQEGGVPMPVERTWIAPPRCRIGAITLEERAAVCERSPVGAKYDAPVNRESAYEMLSRKVAPAATPETAPPPPKGAPPDAPAPSERSKIDEVLWGTKRRQGMVETMAKQAARTVGGQIGRRILRGVLGGVLGGSRGR